MPCTFDSIFQLALGCKKSLIITKLYSEAVIEQGQTIKRPKNEKGQNATEKTKDWAPMTPQKKWSCSGAPEGRRVATPLLKPVVLFLFLNFRW